ncbi:Zn-dependent hydrolase [Parahaliea mediterranea]|uniref:Zn-dependent hydrolase n=2 Tax=Parahaliea mediterranea TaxID=651086 RepID=A0A939INY7_9GAMM|nr:Zn-dependent hydrolase [Parahaliea mediterranea]
MVLGTVLSVFGGTVSQGQERSGSAVDAVPGAALVSPQRLRIYAPVELTADLTGLGDRQREMLALLIDAAELMDELFWDQAFGFENKERLHDLIADRSELHEFARVNYGPWDRLNGNSPFVAGFGAKPEGANFYPADMDRDEFEAWDEPAKRGQYSLVRRDGKGDLVLQPYSQAYARQLQDAAELLLKASELAEDPGFAGYLKLRAVALVSDDYLASDMAWMDMKSNRIELVIGPIENYEDQLYGYRTAFSAYVLLKDLAWSERLARFAKYLPELQKGLPVDDAYKREMPGTDSDLNAYDVLYYAGDSNAGSKTIAINLPNDERVQLEKGTRRLQLKNAMRAKFDKILVPISEQLIAPELRQHVTFDAFFANTMFHEVAHGLGIKNTITGQGTVRAALKESASALEEGKADILGLYMVTKLHEKGVLEEGRVMDNYVTFLASIFRSVRFGAASAHGKANMVRFNYFRDAGAFTRDEQGRYHVDFDKMQLAMNSLSRLILTLQGDGDYEGVKRLLADQGVIGDELQADLDRLSMAGIPVDIVFRQGKDLLGLR